MKSIEFRMELLKNGKVILGGRILDDGVNLNGVLVLNTESKVEAEKMLANDPSMVVGSQVYEMYDWVGVTGEEFKQL